MVIEEFPGLIEKLCKEYLNTLSPFVREKLNIIEAEHFCREVDRYYKELLNLSVNSPQEFKESVVELGRELYRKNLTIAFVVDAINSLTHRILQYIHTEKLPFELSEEFLKFINKFPNLIAYGFILESIPDREKALSTSSKSLGNEISKHLKILKEFIGKRKTDSLDSTHCLTLEPLERLDFRISCKKLDICEKINKTHELLHVYINLLKDYLSHGKFLAGYLVLEDVFFLIERLYENLLSLESTSAALTFDDVVKFIVEEKIEDCFSILVINPIDLAFVNKVYGFEVGDSILEEVINGLSILADRKRVVKCNEGLICAFLNDCSRSAAVNGKKVFKGIKENLSRKFSYLPYKPDISGYLLIFTEKSTLKINDLTNLLKYALRISRQKPSELLILSTDELISSKSIFVFKNTVDYLKETFESGRVALAIQGIHEIETAKVKHYEVLFRLIDEAGRIIPAGEVIDLIYDFRLIHLLDLAVLKKVFLNIEKFKNLNRGIFINVSPRTLKLRTTREEIEKIIGNLVRKGLKVGFEITEQAAIEDFNVIVDFFTKLPTELAIDDFGTGYSSFSNFISLVEQLQIKYLKIDGSYVRKLEESVNTEKVIGALNSMAHSLGIETIAEFASSWEIVEKLKKLNIDYAQGFFFSKPEIVVV